MLAADEIDEVFNQQVEEALEEHDQRAEDYEARELALKVNIADLNECFNINVTTISIGRGESRAGYGKIVGQCIKWP